MMRLRLRLLLVAVGASTGCVFLLGPEDVLDRPCGDDGACLDGFVCRQDVCVPEDDPGEGEGEEGEGEGEGEVVSLSDLAEQASLLPDGSGVILVRDGSLDLVSTATSRVETTTTVPGLTIAGVRAVQACALGGTPIAVVTTSDALDVTDDNGIRDVYRIPLDGEASLASRSDDGFIAASTGGQGVDAAQVSDDCSVLAFATDARIVVTSFPPGFTPGQRYFYAVRGTGLPIPITEPNGDIALDRALEGRLDAAGEAFSFPIAQENQKNILRWDVVSAASRSALAAIGGSLNAACPLYDDTHDVLLFETAVSLVGADTAADVDLYVAFDPFGASPTLTRVGTLRRADTGANSFFHGCLGATLADVGGTLEVVLATTDRLDPLDTDGSTDVYAAPVDPIGKTVGQLRFASFSTDATCAPLVGGEATLLLDVGKNGRFLLVDSGGSSGVVGRMDCAP